jgi:NAD(P)-dependent dehydrogenase (short-subunit alcohol dehydrogenase family)
VSRTRDSLFANRVALVTGAGSGIGAAVARALEAEGATVQRTDLTPVADDRERSDASRTRAPVNGLDVREEGDWAAAMDAVLRQHGRLDALVHAAGISAASPVWDTELTEWRRVLDTNLDGTFLAIRHGIRAMQGTGGAIVVIGSASGIRPPAGAAAYSTSKAAASMLVRAAAKECRALEPPIRINSVSPGGVRTPMWTTMPFFQDLVRTHGSVERAFAVLEAEGGERFADPDDVAHAVLFLLSDAASHITGVELPVDRGYTL